MIGTNIADYVPKELRDRFGAGYLDVILAGGRAQGVFSVISKVRKKIYLLYQNYKVEEPGTEPLYHRFLAGYHGAYMGGAELLQTKRLTEEASKAKETFLQYEPLKYVRP